MRRRCLMSLISQCPSLAAPERLEYSAVIFKWLSFWSRSCCDVSFCGIKRFNQATRFWVVSLTIWLPADGALQVMIDIDGQHEWRDCLDLPGVKLPQGYYFGASAVTGDLSGYLSFRRHWMKTAPQYFCTCHTHFLHNQNHYHFQIAAFCLDRRDALSVHTNRPTLRAARSVCVWGGVQDLHVYQQ